MKNTLLRRYITLTFLLFFGTSCFLLSQEDKSSDKVEVKVLYFHATSRCQTCLKIEDYSQKTINSNFTKELEKGKITWESIDFQDEKNEHFVDEYKLETQALIVAKFKNGKQVKWKSLEKIWDLVGDFDKFQKYIKKELKSFL
jgi:hypothetical protein